MTNIRTILIALAFIASPAFGQCDTIAPSGKVLFSDPGEWRTETGYPRSIQVLDSMQYFTTRVRVDSPCVVVKAFGCPTCGSEKRKCRWIEKIESRTIRVYRDTSWNAYERIPETPAHWDCEFGIVPVNGPVSVCSECGTLYSGRRRK